MYFVVKVFFLIRVYLLSFLYLELFFNIYILNILLDVIFIDWFLF